MHRMVVHAEIHEADTDAVPEPHDKRCCRWTGFSIEDQPVELHVHRVGYGIIRQHRIFLQMDQEVLIAMRLVGLFGVHDEGTEHSSHLLHRHVRVVEIRAFLMDIELIDESAARLYWFLADARHAIHAVRNFEAVPVHRRWLRKMIVEDDAYMVALIHLNWGPCSAPAEAPG